MPEVQLQSMHIYLDSKDHITLTEKWEPGETDRFEEKLRGESAQLVFSMYNIVECCRPLLQAGSQTNVMRTLNRLEKMPHVYINEANIQPLELREATEAFLERRECRPIYPFVRRFDYVVSAFEEPITRNFLRFSLTEIVFELWNEAPDIFESSDKWSKKFKSLLHSDRKLSNYRQRKQNFSNTIRRNLDLYNIRFPVRKIRELSRWIWNEPSRCPAVRLGYEVYHKILRNITDTGQGSDIPDLAHVGCVPYVDVATLDNRVRGYIEQVDRSIDTSYSNVLHRNIDEIREMELKKA